MSSSRRSPTARDAPRAPPAAPAARGPRRAQGRAARPRFGPVLRPHDVIRDARTRAIDEISPSLPPGERPPDIHTLAAQLTPHPMQSCLRSVICAGRELRSTVADAMRLPVTDASLPPLSAHRAQQGVAQLGRLARRGASGAPAGGGASPPRADAARAAAKEELVAALAAQEQAEQRLKELDGLMNGWLPRALAASCLRSIRTSGAPCAACCCTSGLRNQYKQSKKPRVRLKYAKYNLIKIEAELALAARLVETPVQVRTHIDATCTLPFGTSKAASCAARTQRTRRPPWTCYASCTCSLASACPSAPSSAA